MSSRTTYICDRCSKEAPEEGQGKHPRNWGIIESPSGSEFLFCPSCRDAFVQAWDAFFHFT